MRAPQLELDDAVQLLAASVSRLCARLDVRGLLIKGQPAVTRGVRADRRSVDVDLWVDPARHADLLVDLEEQGWERYPSPAHGFSWGHATTLTHPRWPCSLDLHRTFPGFLADSSLSFEEVWSRRDRAVVAGQPVFVPGVVAAAAITTLHTIRSEYAMPETSDDLATALARAATFTDVERADLLQLAHSTNAVATLAPLLAAAGLDATEASGESAELRDWNARLAIAGTASLPWVYALRHASPLRWPVLLYLALKPSVTDLATARSRPGRLPASIRAVAARWRRGMRGLIAYAFDRPSDSFGHETGR